MSPGHHVRLLGQHLSLADGRGRRPRARGTRGPPRRHLQQCRRQRRGGRPPDRSPRGRDADGRRLPPRARSPRTGSPRRRPKSAAMLIGMEQLHLAKLRALVPQRPQPVPAHRLRPRRRARLAHRRPLVRRRRRLRDHPCRDRGGHARGAQAREGARRRMTPAQELPGAGRCLPRTMPALAHGSLVTCTSSLSTTTRRSGTRWRARCSTPATRSRRPATGSRRSPGCPRCAPTP